MKLETTAGTYRLHFSHPLVRKEVGELRMSGRRHVMVHSSTICKLHAGDCVRGALKVTDGDKTSDLENSLCRSSAFIGQALLHPKDQFSRASGRKVALAKAMKAAALDRAVREKIWVAYFGKLGKY